MVEYELAYNDKASVFISEIQSFAAKGYVASTIQPSVKESGSSTYKYVLLMERTNKKVEEI